MSERDKQFETPDFYRRSAFAVVSGLESRSTERGEGAVP